MSDLAERAEEYLRLRRALGHELDDAVRLLPRFVAYLDSLDVSTITTEVALSWVQQLHSDPTSSVWLRRMTVVRGFARHMSGIDPLTEVPPVGLVTFRQRWRPPFIYSSADVAALMNEVLKLVPTPARAATFQTMIGLLSATGMRVGEVIRLGRSDVDWSDGVLVVRATKFKKSREVALDPSVVEALDAYAKVRDETLPHPKSPAFFVSTRGTPVIYTDFGNTFRRLLVASGVGASSPKRPRIHDFRHTFAVHTLVRWYRSGEDVAALLPRLSTYLGHIEPRYTYAYLSAAPELLELALDRLERTCR
jgi:integrase/recombinase XerD